MVLYYVNSTFLRYLIPRDQNNLSYLVQLRYIFLKISWIQWKLPLIYQKLIELVRLKKSIQTFYFTEIFIVFEFLLLLHVWTAFDYTWISVFSFYLEKFFDSGKKKITDEPKITYA